MKRILKLANCFHYQIDDNLLKTFFKHVYNHIFHIAIMGMKKDTLFKHKETKMTCEKNMGNANEYHKLLEPLTKQKRLVKERKHK
jgi:hypothetical protein